MAGQPAGRGTTTQPGALQLQPMAAETISDVESHAVASSEDVTADGGAGGAGRLALRYGGPRWRSSRSRQVRSGRVTCSSSRRPGAAVTATDGTPPPPPRSSISPTWLAAAASRPAAVRVGPTLAQAIQATAPSLAEPVRQLIAQITADLEDDTPGQQPLPGHAQPDDARTGGRRCRSRLAARAGAAAAGPRRPAHRL